MICQRCKVAIGQEERWAQILRKGASLEPLGFFYLCEDCHELLLTFVKLTPDTPDLWRDPEPDAEHPQPFSCFDERLELS